MELNRFASLFEQGFGEFADSLALFLTGIRIDKKVNMTELIHFSWFLRKNICINGAVHFLFLLARSIGLELESGRLPVCSIISHIWHKQEFGFKPSLGWSNLKYAEQVRIHP